MAAELGGAPATEALNTILTLTAEKRDAEVDIQRIIAGRRAAILRLHDADVGPTEMARTIRAAMVAAGWTPAEIKGSGVGYDSIRRIIENRSLT